MEGIIYVADDEKNIRELIGTFLREEGFTVKLFETGDLLLEELKIENPDLVILDIMMPGTDGFSVCSAIRKKSDIPIILLTARDTDADYITGFTLGCDDYFTKPFSPVKLTMRVKAMLKRISGETKVSTGGVSYGDIRIDADRRAAFCKEKEIKLTNTEYTLLSYLLDNRDKAVSREELLNVIWGYDSDVETRVTDDTIKRLRKKMRTEGSTVSIETVWGFGFKLSMNG